MHKEQADGVNRLAIGKAEFKRLFCPNLGLVPDGLPNRVTDFVVLQRIVRLLFVGARAMKTLVWLKPCLVGGGLGHEPESAEHECAEECG